MNNSNPSSRQAASLLADETNQEPSPRSISMAGESVSPPREASPPESEEWLRFGTAGQARLAVLRATVSSIEWQPKPHLLRLSTQQDGVVVVNLLEWDLASGEALWQGLVEGSRSVVNAPYELPEPE